MSRKIACMSGDSPEYMTGCGLYRIYLPYSLLGADIYYNVLEVFTNDMLKDFGNKLGMPIVDIEPSKKEYDIFVFQRVFSPAVVMAMKYLRSIGKIVVEDMDDNFLSIPRDNPAWMWTHPANPQKQDTRIMKESFRVSNYLTVTTNRLKVRFAQFNENIEILPNYIDISQYPEIKREKKNDVVIGWCGSITHVEDLRIAVEPLKRLLERYKFVKLAIGGDKKVFDYFKTVPERQKIFLESVSMEEYPKMVANFDIGIVPLVDNEFNAGKSDIKGKEMMACSMPVVASGTPAYEELIEDGVDGYIADYGKRFYPLLEKVVTDQDLRIEMSKKAREKAITFDIKNNISRWEDFYKRITGV